MTTLEFKSLLSSSNDIATIVTTLKNEILELTPKNIQEIKKEFIESGEFKIDLEYSKKAVLSHYSNKLSSILDTYISETKNKDIKKSLKGLFKPLNDVLSCRAWLIDLRFHSFDSLVDKESLIKFCERVTTSKNSDYFMIDSLSINKIGDTFHYSSERLFSVTKIKNLNGSNNDDGGAVFSANSLLQFLKNEIDSNKELNKTKLKEYNDSLILAQETLAQ